MRSTIWRKSAVFGLTGVVLLAPPRWCAAAESTEILSNRVDAHASDVALSAGGVLSGQVVTAQGSPLAGNEVRVASPNGESKSVTTDAEGRFRVTGLRGGAYAVTTANASVACRLWANGAVPPGAKSSILVVERQDIVRGNLGDGGFVGGSRGGLVMLGLAGGIVAGGIVAQEHASGS